MKKLIASMFGLVSILLSTAVFADRVFQTSEMLTGPDSNRPFLSPQGAAWLRRSPGHVSGRIMVKVDMANTPYTIWAIVFNNPTECAGAVENPPEPCGLPDLFNPLVEAAVFNASGAISAADGGLKTNGKPAGGGVINVDLELVAGEGSDKGYAPFPPLPDPLPDINGILNRENGCGAEIHFDVNQHDVFDEDWATELTQPEGDTHRFAVFPAIACNAE